MKNTKKRITILLCVLLLLGIFPVSGFTASSEIWPGYPAVDQLPTINTIPDPFKFFNAENDPTGDGHVSSSAEWVARRNEIKELVQRYWLGYRWPTAPENVTGKTQVIMEPNTISLGFDWPPYSYATVFNLRDEFYNLAEKLLEGTVEILEVIPPADIFGAPTLGEIKFTFGPAADPAEAEELAIQAWNAGYYLPYTSFFSTSYAVLRDYTGALKAAPGAQKPVSYNTVTITNPDNGVQESFNIDIKLPTVTQAVYAWEDFNPSVTEAVYWDDLGLQVPVIIDIGGAAASHVASINDQGYGYINFTPTDIYPDDSSASDGINRDGIYTRLYPYNKDEYEYASGALMAWGWGVSQIISAMEQPVDGGTQTWGEALHIDPSKTLVTGHSRYGKAAMFAAAFDDRIGICLASEPGGSGIQSYRYKVEGKIFNFNTYPKADRVYGKTEIPTVSYGEGNSWFPETAGRFVNKDNQLPFDSSDIIALVAPRPFFATTGIDTHWLGNEGGVAAVQAASEVYNYIGKDSIEKNNIAVRARQSDHVLYNRDLPFVVAIMDREFKQRDENTLHVKDLFPDGEGLGNMSYPAKDYNDVSEFNSYPFDINSSYLPWSRPDKYTLWTNQENFLVGYPVTITAHSNAPDVKLYLPNGAEINAVSQDGEVFTFNLAAEQAVYGRYELRTIGDDKENRSVFFAAVSLADSLRHATSKGDEGEENRLIGFSSRLANNVDNPPEVYIDGKRVTMSFTPERFKTEDTTLLEYGVLFHDPLFARIATEGWDETKTFNIKNLNFVTIPGFTFEISFGNIKASAENNGKEFAADFTQPISWNVEKFNNGPAKVWPEIPDTKEEKETLQAGGTVTRPEAPLPKATNFDSGIKSTRIEYADNKTNVIIDFDSDLDTREYGFGFDVTDNWDTTWSEDKKQVTLSIDYAQFPVEATANLIIFRLKDAEGNMIPGPKYLTLSHPNNILVDEAIKTIEEGKYIIPLGSQSTTATKTAWVQAAVNARIPDGNGSTATVTYDNGYKVLVTNGLVTKSAVIKVTLERDSGSGSGSGSGSSGSSSSSPAPTPVPKDGTTTMYPMVHEKTGTLHFSAQKAKELLIKNVTVKVPEIKSLKVNTYAISIPAISLTDGNGEGTLTISTNIGTIVIPDNMLAGITDFPGKEAVINLCTANKEELPDEINAAVGDRPVIQLSLFSEDGKQIVWDNPDRPITIAIPYTPPEEELKNPDQIVAWFIDDNGEVETIPSGRYNEETGSVTFKSTNFNLYAVAYVQKSFNDLDSTEWARKSIEALAAKAVLYAEDDNFQPSENITRADFLYGLVRALSLNTKLDGNFPDISEDAYYYKEIGIAKELGITLGTGNNQFSPDLHITRQDMMTLTGRTLKLLNKLELKASDSVLDKFTDKSDIADYAVNSVAALVDEELIVGSNNKVMPRNNATRAEAAEFLYRIYHEYQ